MKVVEINSVSRGSTGNIMLNIANVVRKNGDIAYTFSEKRKGVTAPKGHEFFGSSLENMLHRLYSVTSGISGTGSKHGTKKLIEELKRIEPDIIHLHNLHGWFVNVPMLFDFIRKKHIKTIWTLHDCWGFTAQCSHFTIEKCEKWKTGCYECPRYKTYPYTYVDQTEKMWKLKKQWFSGIDNLTIVTPSDWLANLVKQSFLQKYEVKVINNGINLKIFKPLKSDFREQRGIQNKIVLGVSSVWNNHKGLDVFIKLSEILGSQYTIVLVGTDEKLDTLLPDKIVSIHRTNNQSQLAEIYSVADVFVNPTREENFPTVNIEAIACGTPVVTFRTGGSPEIINDETGFVVECDDTEDLRNKIVEVCEKKDVYREECMKRSKMFDMYEKFQEYYNLYSEKAYRR